MLENNQVYSIGMIERDTGIGRDTLPDDVDIWTGGEGVRRLRNLPAGVTRFNSLEKLPLPAEAPGEMHEPRKETAQ